MFYYVKGKVAICEPGVVVIDAGGVGYAVQTSATSASQVQPGDNATFYTYLHVREDIFDLYGFITRDEARNNTYPEVPVWHNGTSSQQMSQRTNVSKQYVGREPRFYASVAYNGSVWQQLENNSQSLWGVQVTYYRAGTDGYKNSFSYLRTGIGVKKYYNPHDWINAQNSYDHICEKYEPAIRYADILLMYAECLNELTQGQSYQQKDWKGNDIVITGRDISEMKRGIRPVRIRAGLPDYTDGIYNSQDDLRAKTRANATSTCAVGWMLLSRKTSASMASTSSRPPRIGMNSCR